MFRLTYDEVLEHIDVPRETYDRLTVFYDLLVKWQEKVNLISDSTKGEIWERHIIDSLQLLPYVPREATVLDIGTGAGFPGLILGIAGRRVTLVERDAKKAAFLGEAARVTGAKVTIFATSAEDLPSATYDVITSRACAPLNKLLEMSSRFCHADSIYLVHKGARHMEEIISSQRHWQFSYKTIPSITSSEGVILHVEELRPIKTKTERHS